MPSFRAIFKIIEEKSCPLYDEGDLLNLSERTISCPAGKEVCLILVRDMTELLFTILAGGDKSASGAKIFNCSGCSGLIKFALYEGASLKGQQGAIAQIGEAVEEVYGMRVKSDFLETFPADKIGRVLRRFRLIELAADSILIRRGEQNLNLYVVMEGQLAVEEYGVQLSLLGEGELCGEMSYLGADVAVSSVRAVAKTIVLAIEGNVFGELLGDNQDVQSYMAKLLAIRLRKTNESRARELDSCMSGRVDEIVPAELLQIFHMHQKTGVLSLDLKGGAGKVSFRDGCIINAVYGKLKNQEAIFEMLQEKKGIYKFTMGLSPDEMKAAEIGDFMMLLMEGVKRVDED
jgi:CRP/FNR family cyclic AMP-dependent transcriptional regulator